MTVPDAVEKYLKLMKVTKEIPEIAEGILKGGLKSSSKNFTDFDRTVMSRDDRFVKVPNGDWGLVEWYPAMRKEKKSKATTKPVSAVQHQSESTKPTTDGTAEDKILAAMRAKPNEEWTQGKLAVATGLKTSTTAGTVFRLRKEEKIKSRENGKGYVIA